MTTKGKETREMIIRLTAPILNKKGFQGLSYADIMEATGLKKGGIYNHFQSKDELALEAFEYAFHQMEEKFKEAVTSKDSYYEKLISLITVYGDIIDNPPLAGGCPLLNMAVDSDDTHPELREKAQTFMKKWIDLIIHIVKKGKEKGEFLAGINEVALASFIISSTEGAVMLSRLYGDSSYMHDTINHVKEYVSHYVR